MSRPRAITLATDAVRVVVVPDTGGKIASLEHRDSGREWLLPPPRRWPPPPSYGSRFTSGPLWGWDEMVPTIDPCGDLPDHGEVWALPWTATQTGDTSLRCAVAGRALPYRLVRDLEVLGARVTLDYELVAATPMAVLWAAHPQLVLDPAGTRVILPAGVDRLLDVTAGDAVGAARREALEDPLAGVPLGAGRKLYVDPAAAAAAGWVELADRRGPWLRMGWDAEQVPYLGAWIDHAAYAPRPVVVVEPANAYYDSLERAVALRRAAEVAPDRPLRWRLTLDLGSGAR